MTAQDISSVTGKMSGLSIGYVPIEEELLAKETVPEISAVELQNSIRKFLAKDFTVIKNREAHKKKLQAIRHYFRTPNLVSDATGHGGMKGIIKTYTPRLLWAKSQFCTKMPVMTPQQAAVVVKGFTSLARLFKMRKAYANLRQGKKFQLSESVHPAALSTLQQPNCIEELSKQNIQRLITRLSETGTNAFGLRDDELSLYKWLLELPYRMQHATNHYYAIANSGALDSYEEIQRTRPEYESPFSTLGNVKSLGNHGFTFFRIFVDGINGETTRYGNSRIVTDLSLIEKSGWISLRDQLVPLSSKGTRRAFEGKALLKVSAVVGINATTADKKLKDGIETIYRREKFPESPYRGKEDTQKSLREDKCAPRRKVSFTEEIFYGPDIYRGVALSVIDELRNYENNGYRARLLKRLNKSRPAQRIRILGKFVKKCYRIEGKYPTSVHLREAAGTNQLILKGTDPLHPVKVEGHIDNPDGDGRRNRNLSINEKSMKQALLKEDKKRIEGKLSVARRQVKRKSLSPAKTEHYTKEKSRLEIRHHYVKAKIASSKSERMSAIQHFIKHYGISKERLAKVDNTKLLLIRDAYDEFLADKLITFDKLIAAPFEQLERLAEQYPKILDMALSEVVKLSTLIDEGDEGVLNVLDSYEGLFECVDNGYIKFDDLVSLDWWNLSQLGDLLEKEGIKTLVTEEKINGIDLSYLSKGDAQTLQGCTEGELEHLAECDNLKDAVEYHGFKELISKLRVHPMHLTCLTTDDLEDVFVEYALSYPHILKNYVEEVDLESVRQEIHESELMKFDTEYDYVMPSNPNLKWE